MTGGFCDKCGYISANSAFSRYTLTSNNITAMTGGFCDKCGFISANFAFNRYTLTSNYNTAMTGGCCDKCGYISANSVFNRYTLSSNTLTTMNQIYAFINDVIVTAMISISICGICDKITSFSAFTAGHCDSPDSNIYLRHLRQNYLVFRIHHRSLRQL